MLWKAPHTEPGCCLGWTRAAPSRAGCVESPRVPCCPFASVCTRSLSPSLNVQWTQLPGLPTFSQNLRSAMHTLVQRIRQAVHSLTAKTDWCLSKEVPGSCFYGGVGRMLCFHSAPGRRGRDGVFPWAPELTVWLAPTISALKFFSGL